MRCCCSALRPRASCQPASNRRDAMCSDNKYAALEKSSEERYKDLQDKSSSQLSKAEKDAADNDARLKKEAAAAAVMAEEKYNSLVAEKKSAEKGTPPC